LNVRERGLIHHKDLVAFFFLVLGGWPCSKAKAILHKMGDNFVLWLGYFVVGWQLKFFCVFFEGVVLTFLSVLMHLIRELG